MHDILLDCTTWDTADMDAKERLARALDHVLAPRLRFQHLEPYALYDQEHTIAQFIADDGAAFALLPGYQGELGYDNTIHPQREELAQEAAEHVFLPVHQDVAAWFRKVLTPLRRVVLPPFFIEMAATPLRTYEQGPDGMWFADGGPFRRTEVLAGVARVGWRVPTSDEWEYACSGGTRAFFRWGNTWPPVRWTDEVSRGAGEWREDLKPNAFGLRIGQHPWHVEYCAEPDVVRGGDGGSTVSIGTELKEEWLSFATSYRYPFTAEFVERLQSPYLRRAFSLPDAR